MRTIITHTFISLDGVMQGPGGPEEDRSGGFRYGGWTVPYWDKAMEEVMGKASEAPYDLLLGRRTYEIFAAHWPFITDDPMADKLNAARKYVASRTLSQPTWNDTVVLKDAAAEVARLKATDGPTLQVFGSADLMQTLLKQGLVDRMSIWTYPVLLGKGKRLFVDEEIAGGWNLTEHRVSDSGVMMTTYEPAGEVRTGSFALERPSELELERRSKNR